MQLQVLLCEVTKMIPTFDIAGFLQHPLSTHVILIPSVILLSLALYFGFSSRKSSHAPGPKSYPLIGHTFQVPLEKTWIYFEQLGKKYGDFPLILSDSFLRR